ncbi:YycH family regulatory protein [Lysinibacillus sp. NPDC097287]|uniref:YycH family regulatory protein n=1 Tax=Lysinibacillus sp. NPDC097287 TaxID=3364144 RepID=UPI003812F4C2
MKYIEPVKSVVLFVFVILSVVLTFLIWTYSPDYEYVEKIEGKEEIAVGTKKAIDDVIKPYKAIFRAEDKWTGTASSGAMRDLMNAFDEWESSGLELINGNVSPNYLNEIVRTNNRLTVFFAGEVPFPVFNSVLHFDDKELPETTFNRIIIDWDKYNNNELDLFFVSDNNTSLLHSRVRIPDGNQFIEEIIEPSKKYNMFKEVERDGYASLYVVDEKVEMLKYTYVNEKLSEELALEKFKNVLFADPNVVKRNEGSATVEKYTDGMSLMTVDTHFKSLNYVYPAAESSVRAIPSKIVKDSFDFVNEHGGFTADYRYVSMNPSKNQMDYQLYLEGFPVYSDQITTRITTVWGDNRIFGYKRPYFSLDMDIASEKEIKGLPSGTEIIEKVRKLDTIALSDVDEIVVGYYLTQDENQQLFKLEPAWFLVHKGTWKLLTPEMLGGVENRLE